MSRSLLVPISLAAKVVKTDVQVPDPAAAMNNVPVPSAGSPKQDLFAPTVPLKAGVHVHWALPDALSQGKILTKPGQHGVIVPGVPDTWLIVRLDPVISGSQRTWTGRVLDSRTGVSTLWDQWAPAANPDATRIHTVLGMLPSAANLGYPGWGYLDETSGTFDPVQCVYYPSVSGRLGFRDTPDGLKGNVSYSVVGWYSIREQDPLFSSTQRDNLLWDWKLWDGSLYQMIRELFTHVSISPQINASPWIPKIDSLPDQKPAARSRRLKENAPAGASGRIGQVTKATDSFSTPQGAGKSVSQSPVSAVGPDAGASDIVCHGSLVQVNLAGPSEAQSSLTDVRLFPSMKRAMASISAMDSATGTDIDHVEMLLQDLDHQKDTSAGLIDLAGGAHALSFHGTPGQSQFYARLEVHDPLFVEAQIWDLATMKSTNGSVSSGRVRRMRTRSASAGQGRTAADIPPTRLVRPSGPQIQAPDPKQLDSEFDVWQNGSPDGVKPVVIGVKPALAAVVKATPPGVQVNPDIIRVMDYRAKAQPYRAGPIAGDEGANGAGAWLDVNDEAAMKQMFLSSRGAWFGLPDPDNLFEVPGPRWYRPSAPHLVVSSAKRSYRFAADGRFEKNGFLACRLGGETVFGIRNNQQQSLWADTLLLNSDQLRLSGKLPADAWNLVEETALLDTDNAPPQFVKSITGIWASRDASLTPDQVQALLSVSPTGKVPSPVAFTQWIDPWDPVFIDCTYAYCPSAVQPKPGHPLDPNWKLDEGRAEFDMVSPPAADPTEVYQQRCPVTTSLVNVLQSAFVTRTTLDRHANLVPAVRVPHGMDEQTFLNADILSVALTGFDANLFAAGHRLRAGALFVQKIDLVDVFGTKRTFQSAKFDPNQLGKATQPSWATPLEPRLPNWSRLQFRLLAADQPQGAGAGQPKEASAEAAPICGFLVPNFLEHSLEVIDSASGIALGRIWSDPPQFGNSSAQPATLGIYQEVYPWTPQVLKLDPAVKLLDAILNPTLRAVVAGVMQQTTTIDAKEKQVKENYHETGLTAMLRVIDTIRATVDPTPKNDDLKVRLLGRPIAIVGANLSLQSTPTSSPSDVKKGPPALPVPPPVPSIPVRIGAADRPDDGVLGCFIPATSPDPKDSRFSPVSSEAASNAMFDGLLQGLSVPVENNLSARDPRIPATHPFLRLDHEFLVSSDQPAPIPVTILCDMRAGIYATCGVLPRKKIVFSKEFLDAAAKNLQPVLSIGPIMMFSGGAIVEPVVPAPDIQGYTVSIVRPDPKAAGSFPASDVPPALAMSQLPPDRASLSDGWFRLIKNSEKTIGK